MQRAMQLVILSPLTYIPLRSYQLRIIGSHMQHTHTQFVYYVGCVLTKMLGEPSSSHILDDEDTLREYKSGSALRLRDAS